MSKKTKLNPYDELSRRECILLRVNQAVYCLDFLFAATLLKDCGVLTHRLAFRNETFRKFYKNVEGGDE